MSWRKLTREDQKRVARSRAVARAALLCLATLFAGSSASGVGASLEEGLDSMAASLAAGLGEHGVHRLAVVEFTDIRGYESALDPFLAEELTTRLFALDRTFRIVERRQLQRVLEEQKLTASALFDESTIAAVGKALGIEAIVTGSVSDLGSEVRVNARAIAVDTAQVFAAAAASLPMSGSVEFLVRQSAAPPSEQREEHQAEAIQVQPADAFYQNSFMRASIASVSRVGPGVRIALVVENLTAKTILLAVDEYHAPATLADHSGNEFYMSAMSGIRKWW